MDRLVAMGGSNKPGGVSSLSAFSQGPEVLNMCPSGLESWNKTPLQNFSEWPIIPHLKQTSEIFSYLRQIHRSFLFGLGR